MATVIVYSTTKVDELIDGTVASAAIVDGNLIITKGDGSTVDLGEIKDHGALTGLTDDDHVMYAKADGSRGAFASEAQGDRADAARLNYMAEGEVDGGDTDGWFEEFTVSDDGTATSGWVNRVVGFFRHRISGTPVADNLRRMVFWLNEYLELRLAPAKHNTVALRIFVRDTSTTQTTARDMDVPILQMMDDRGVRTPIWGLYPGGEIRIAEQEIPTAHVIVLGDGDPVPTGTPAGTVIVRTP